VTTNASTPTFKAHYKSSYLTSNKNRFPVKQPIIAYYTMKFWHKSVIALDGTFTIITSVRLRLHQIKQSIFTHGPYRSVSEIPDLSISASVSGSDPHGYTLILIGWIQIRIQEGKNDPKKKKKEEISSLKCCRFSFEG
jgi:hypothetical protein